MVFPSCLRLDISLGALTGLLVTTTAPLLGCSAMQAPEQDKDSFNVKTQSQPDFEACMIQTDLRRLPVVIRAFACGASSVNAYYDGNREQPEFGDGYVLLTNLGLATLGWYVNGARQVLAVPVSNAEECPTAPLPVLEQGVYSFFLHDIPVCGQRDHES